VDDVDTFDNNTFDSYEGAPGKGHVIHYEQGVGASFGRFAAQPIEYWMGRAPYFQPGSVLASLATLGMISRPWEDVNLQRANAQSQIEWPQLGYYDAAGFNPRRWRPVADNPAFVRQTARDRYWGAKQVVAFDADEIRAAIRAGHFPPVVAEHLFDVLWKRRERIARQFFTEVAPLDHFTLNADQVCFEDLWINAGLGGEAGTSYQAREREGSRSTPLTVRGRCAFLKSGDGYHIVELSARRPGQKGYGPRVEVHVTEREGARHIVGVRR
jgi:hypothetical protein